MESAISIPGGNMKLLIVIGANLLLWPMLAVVGVAHFAFGLVYLIGTFMQANATAPALDLITHIAEKTRKRYKS